MRKFFNSGHKNKTSMLISLDNIRFLLDILRRGSGRRVFEKGIEVPKVLILLVIFGFLA